MKHLTVPPRAFVRWYTAVIALVCAVAVTVIVHDAPSARASKHRHVIAASWHGRVGTLRDDELADERARLRLRRAYNDLVRASRSSQHRLLAAVHHARRIATHRP
jgi:hypothetical protein